MELLSQGFDESLGMDPHYMCDIGGDWCHSHCHHQEMNMHCDKDHMHCVDSAMMEDGPTFEMCDEGANMCHMWNDIESCHADCYFMGQFDAGHNHDGDLMERECYQYCDMMDWTRSDYDHCHM